MRYVKNIKRLAFACLLAALALGCSSGGQSELDSLPEADTLSESGGDVTGESLFGDMLLVGEPGTGLLAASHKDDLVVLANGQGVLLQLGLDAFQLGVVPELKDSANYDPWYLVSGDTSMYKPIEGMAWRTPVSMEVALQGDEALAVTLDYGDGLAATLHLALQATGRFKVQWSFTPADAPVAWFRLAPRIDPQEGLYGLGNALDDVNRRGHKQAMQLEAAKNTEGSYNEAHVPIPLLIGTRGWGLFVESRYPGAWDVASQADDRVEVTYGTGLASRDGLTFHLVAEAHPLDITKHYYAITGQPTLPAKWALGPWIWRDENDDQAQVEADLDHIRDLDLPATGYWIDRPYATDVETFDFNPAQFPDAAAMIGKMHRLGFRTALWHAPYLDDKGTSQALKDLRQHAIDQGFYPPKTGLLLNKWGKPIDLTNPDAYQWWKENLKKYADLGVEGFKLDYAEDVVTGFSAARVNVWTFADGSDERTMHGLYYHLNASLAREVLPPEGGFLLVRHGCWGGQVLGPIVWPGDLDADLSHNGQEVTGEDGKAYHAVGGLPASLVTALSLGPSGFPFYGSDTGGYRHSPPSEETFIRWFEQTALSSVMQIGTSSNDVAWEFFNESNDPDGKWLGLYRDLTRLHLRLFPLEWTLANRMLEDGRPLMRPFGLQEPGLGLHPNDQYFFGDDLLVAPVVEAGKTSRDVIFPAGRWMDWFTGEVIEAGTAGKTVTVAAPLDTLPLYLREGGIVPLLRPTIDAIAPTQEPDRVDSLATTPGVLYARVFPSPGAAFTVYDGTQLGADGDRQAFTLSCQPGSAFNLGALFEVTGLGTSQPHYLQEEGQELAHFDSLGELEAAAGGWTWDPDRGGTLYVKVTAGQHSAQITF
jgi:alpha-D-xyloside xylohydrolase